MRKKPEFKFSASQRRKTRQTLSWQFVYVLEKQATEIIVIGALGGRLDQMLGNLSLLTDVPAGVDIRLDDGKEEVMIRGPLDRYHRQAW